MTKYPIYLDYHSTTPVDRRVAEVMLNYMINDFGNASSIDHLYGEIAQNAVTQATQNIAKLINCSPSEIIFTSGATESINLAIQGHILATQNHTQKQTIALTKLEHKAVLDTCQALAKKGLANLIYLPVDQLGRIDLDYLEKILRNQQISLLCIMAANNEIGNIYPIEKIGKIAQTYNIPFLCDASQAVGKVPLNFTDWGITYLTLSGHKIYGPKGIGALVIKKGNYLEPIIFGGGQQKGQRSGTLNVPGIVGLGEACRWRELEMISDEKRISHQRDRLQQLLLEKIPNLVINGDLNSRLAGNLHISIPNIPNTAIIARTRDRLAISTGAACTSGVMAPSHVLQAIGLSNNIISGALRISLGKFTLDEDIQQTAQILVEAVTNIQLLIS